MPFSLSVHINLIFKKYIDIKFQTLAFIFFYLFKMCTSMFSFKPYTRAAEKNHDQK